MCTDAKGMVLSWEAISSPGALGRANEDVARVDPPLAWVADGATNLLTHPTTPAADPRWLVAELDRHLQREDVRQAPSLMAALSAVAQAVRRRYVESFGPPKARGTFLPSAALALVRWDRDGLDYLLLGDCSILILQPDGTCLELVDERIAPLSLASLEALQRELRRGRPPEAALKAIGPLLRSHRRRMNQEGGYWVFSVDEEAPHHAKTGRVELSGTTQVLLASDGFSRLWDLFRFYRQPCGVFEDIRGRGLPAVLATLRGLEEREDLLTRPRLKISDDASCAVVTLRPP